MCMNGDTNNEVFVDDPLLIHERTAKVDAHISVVTTSYAFNKNETTKNRRGVCRASENINALIE